MGVKGLWSILEPISQKGTLYDLQNTIVAVDLSCWVCEDQSVGEKAAQFQMHLRNLFFRTSTLLMLNITPIFVLEGEAPQSKLNTMADRLDLRFKSKTSDSRNTHSGNRNHFKGILKKCRNLLEMMGVQCVQADGEAEALCGQLNAEGLVAGVITQDSDAFLYGARIVYRNLQIKDGCGSIEIYDMSHIESKLNFNRDKLVAMSLFCGCDYDQTGVYGIGKETAVRYLSAFEGNILERLRNIRNDPNLVMYEEERAGCTKCSHQGRLIDHKKNGCPKCYTSKSCNENYSLQSFKNLNDSAKRSVTFELNLRQKILEDTGFPNEQTISEFLKSRKNPVQISLEWRSPNVVRFTHFANDLLDWPIEYAFEKMLRLATRWQLVQKEVLLNFNFEPVGLLKKRVTKGVPSVEVAWNVIGEDVRTILALLPENCSFIKDTHCITLEPISIVSVKLITLYDDFIESTKKKKKKAGKTKEAKSLKEKPIERQSDEDVKIEKRVLGSLNDEVREALEQLSIDSNKGKLDDLNKNESIDLPRNNARCNFEIDVTLGESFSEIINEPSFIDLTQDETLPYESDEHDLSDIINNIVSKRRFY